LAQNMQGWYFCLEYIPQYRVHKSCSVQLRLHIRTVKQKGIRFFFWFLKT
jgi:hypothetical protein